MPASSANCSTSCRRERNRHCGSVVWRILFVSRCPRVEFVQRREGQNCGAGACVAARWQRWQSHKLHAMGGQQQQLHRRRPCQPIQPGSPPTWRKVRSAASKCAPGGAADGAAAAGCGCGGAVQDDGGGPPSAAEFIMLRAALNCGQERKKSTGQASLSLNRSLPARAACAQSGQLEGSSECANRPSGSC
jgi:hypothetical protein